jgi:hypothetical protein
MKCRECGKKLDFSGFKPDEDGNQVELYSCRNPTCSKKRDQVRRKKHEV